MSEPSKSMLVYLDASNHFDAMKGTLDVGPLRDRADVAIVFSDAHYDDAGGGGVRGMVEMSTYMSSWSNARHAYPPQRIPAFELRAFVEAWPDLPLAPPRVIWDTPAQARPSDEEAASDSIEVDVAHVESLLDENERIKRQMAIADTISKSITPAPKPSQPPTLDEAADSMIDAMTKVPDEGKSLVRAALRAGVPFPPIPGPYDHSDSAAKWPMMMKLLDAALDGDRARLTVLLAEHDPTLRDISALSANPFSAPLLGKKRQRDRWSSFQANCVGLLGEAGAGLTPDRIQEVFDAMRKYPQLCPAWTLIELVEMRMRGDATTPAKPSDRVDLNHLALLPYVDVLFVDIRIHNYVSPMKDIPGDLRAKCKLASAAQSWIREHA